MEVTWRLGRLVPFSSLLGVLTPRRSGSSSAMSIHSPAWILPTSFLGTGGSPAPMEMGVLFSASSSALFSIMVPMCARRDPARCHVFLLLIAHA